MRCKICKIKYNDYERISKVLISCGHSFCQSCLFSLSKCPDGNCNREIIGYITNYETLEHLIGEKFLLNTESSLFKDEKSIVNNIKVNILNF